MGGKAPSSGALASRMATTTLKVGGMTCGACTSSVESAFQTVDGIGNVSVNLVMERAVVVHDMDKIGAAEICEMIEDRGFDAEVLTTDEPETDDLLADPALGETDDQIQSQAISTTTLHVGGMTCGACTSAVEGAFKDVSGVKSFSISLLSERAVIEHDANIIPPEKLAETIEDVGFDAEVLETKAAQPVATEARRRSKALVKNLITTTVSIGGMTCGACTSAVESGFNGLDGVAAFNISLLAERAVIVHDTDKLNTSQILEIIEDRGFDASLISSREEGVQVSATTATTNLKIYGLPSPESAADVEVKIRNLTGVTKVTVNFGTSRASIAHDTAKVGVRTIVDVIETAGYNALVADNDDNNAQLESLAKTKEVQEWWRAFRNSLIFAVPVSFITMLFPMAIPFLDFGSIEIPFLPGLWLGDIVCLILTIPVQFGIGKRFYISAFKSLKHGSPTMDVLVTLGTSAAFFFSCAAMLVSIAFPPHSRPGTTFETSTMLITFITLGRFLENRAKGQTSKALSRLMSLAPSTATIYADPLAAAKAAEGWDLATANNEKDNSEKGNTPLTLELKTVPSELIEVNDVVLLRPGDKIPADGIVTRGESHIDESMVTGEAMSILKKPGSMLMAGTVNGAGRVDFKVTRTGRDTQLSQIVRLVQEAQTTRAPIQRMADTVAGFFVPIIITLGLGTFVAWLILSYTLPQPPQIFLTEASGGKIMVCVKLCIAVVVFACPCALGLATPTAVMVGTGVGAEQGILVKGGATLETATKIQHIVLDKTGTLTMGKMSVATASIEQSWNASSETRRTWWSVVGLAEGNSEHPIAKAIFASVKERLGLSIDASLPGTSGDFQAVYGSGIIAVVEPSSLRGGQKRYATTIGNLAFLRDQGIAIPSSIIDEDIAATKKSQEFDEASSSSSQITDDSVSRTGMTTIHVAIDSEYTGSIGLADTLKPSARAAVHALHTMGLTISMVTGDQPTAAYHVAELVGIPPANVHASVLPSGKQEIIEELKRNGEIVAMVGDGINDSPALATADVGISLASGTDVAMEAADIVLMKPTQLMDIPASIHLSRTIFRRIKLNLLLSIIYNAVGLPIAMGFLLPWNITLPPVAAGAAMACSSVTVVVSSLLLKFWSRPQWMWEDEAVHQGVNYDLGANGPAVAGPRSFWSSVASLRDLVTKRRRRWSRRRSSAKESKRGAYVPLEDLEAV